MGAGLGGDVSQEDKCPRRCEQNGITESRQAWSRGYISRETARTSVLARPFFGYGEHGVSRSRPSVVPPGQPELRWRMAAPPSAAGSHSAHLGRRLVPGPAPSTAHGPRSLFFVPQRPRQRDFSAAHSLRRPAGGAIDNLRCSMLYSQLLQ